MSGIGGSGHHELFSLLRLITNPQEYEQKLSEFTARRDEAIAAQSDLAAAQQDLADKQATLQKAADDHATAVQSFESDKAHILAKSAEFDQREAAVTSRENAIASFEDRHKAIVSDFENQSSSKTADLNAREASIVDRENNAKAREDALAVNEAAVAQKLSQLRAIVS